MSRTGSGARRREDAAGERVGARASPALLEEIREGLSRPQKELPPKFFYDRRGSELFEEITALPEYYPTRTERALLRAHVPGWMAALRPRSLVELGAGSTGKARIVLDAMVRAGRAERYYPVDISAEFLTESAAALEGEYPTVRTVPVVADISASFSLPADLPRPALFAFLGSTIGNFAPPEAVDLLRRVAAAMTAGDEFLLGVDLRKEVATLEAAYNDARGVTAEFNRNLLRAVNDATGADFDPDGFRHHAFYDREHHRIEMHLVARRPMSVTVPGAGEWRFREGESVRTEISCKHDRDSVEHLMGAAGLRLTTWQTDPDQLYALVLATR